MTTDPTNQQADQPPSQPTAQPTPPPASPNADQQYASFASGSASGWASGPRRLVRRTDDKMLGGVCAGLADHFGIDRTLVRLLAVVVAVLGFGSVIIAYLVAWLIVPKDVDVYSATPTPAQQPQFGPQHAPQYGPQHG
ncbi:PspC domain-containing protein [uncultured Nocardioides sp.]|uniref:PspC domain-containing protein n=1 Tax=uncultured Nocardioides sp. TaxID=198441 RepID=UPI0026260E8F|nr:PspC domain-containing protein [uncultured Nocardioides sp.]